MKKKVIGFVHTHWDREWYREFEVFRMRLLRVFDNILELLESDKLPSFYFDGHTAALEDYLEMRPEKTDTVKKLISDKRLFIGPFYCLIDEFLTDEKVIRKNLEIGLKYAREMGCEDFLGYFADTFGHTPNTIPILKEYGINTAIVWRGCGDIPSEFTWKVANEDNKNKSSINCINLVRGYFNDYISSRMDIDKKAECIKKELDKIAEHSGDVLLMPIGGDHLGVHSDIMQIVDEVNQRLEDYEIQLGSIFDYIELVKNNFSQFEYRGELRDNSKTFTLQGSYSSRLDLKRLNIETSHLLDKADRLRQYFKHETSKYERVIDYAYKFLLQNQAHDSIYGCSLDDVHREDIVRYKKIQQIADTVIDEIRFKNKISDKEIINLGEKYRGTVEFSTSQKLDGFQLIDTQMGFEKELLTDTLRVPVTEDYCELYTYIANVDIDKNKKMTLIPEAETTDVFVSDKCIGNSKIFLSIENDKIKIGNYEMKFIDYIDKGDSYNEGPDENDSGKIGKLIGSNVLYEGTIRSALQFQIDIGDILNVIAELDTQADMINFKIDWVNTYTNHNLQVLFDTEEKIYKTYSEDTNQIIIREFDPDYDIRKNLPKTRGLEAFNNTAPMQRGVWANGIGIVTEGLTQYEVSGVNLGISLLRSTDILSNPKNPARTTPAGPPIALNDLKQLGENSARFSVFLGDSGALGAMIQQIYNYII